MKLRARTALGQLCVAFLMVALLFGASRMVLMKGFERIEVEDIKRDLSQVLDVIAEREQALSTRTADWAYWDDMHQFALDVNQEFIDKNLSDENFANYFKVVNYAIVVNLQNQIVFKKGYDYTLGHEVPVPEALVKRIQPGELLLRHTDTKSHHSGIILSDEGPILLSSYPSLTSEMTGPIHGTVIFGILLDDAYIKNLSETLKSTITIAPCYKSPLVPDMQEAADALQQAPGERHVRILPTGRIAEYTVKRDIYGQPAFVLRVDKERHIYEIGKKVLDYFAFLLLTTGLVLAIASIWILERTVIARLAGLSREVASIHGQADLSRRATVSGKDEIAELAHGVNAMLGAIETTTRSVQINEAHLRAILQTAVDGIITIDAAGIIRSFNKAAEEIFGYATEEVVGQNVRTLMPEPYFEHHDRYISDYIASSIPKLLGTGREVLGKRKDGTIFPLYIAVSEVRTELNPERMFTGIVRDVTERKRYEESLAKAATSDPLTGLANRRGFEEQLAIAMNASKRYGHALSLCMVDLDQFKQINDLYGHAMGDHVLSRFGEIVREGLRREDLAGRFGGDEFCICFTHMPGIAAVQATERIRHVFETCEFVTEQATTFHLSATFGLADLESKDMGHKELFDAADRSLYIAKKRGRNQCCVNGQ